MDLLATITSGLAGWLTYEDMRRKVRHHDEATLAGPIVDLAQDNGYLAQKEFPLPRSEGQRGSPKEVDFVFVHPTRKDVLVLEVKFKKTAKAMAGGIGKDALKIRDLDADMLNKSIASHKLKLPQIGADFRIKHAVLIAWREGDIIPAIRAKEPPVIRKQFMTVMCGMFADKTEATPSRLAEAMLTSIPLKPVTIKAGCLRWGLTQTSQRYWLAGLPKRPTWTKLEDELGVPSQC